MGSRGRSTDRSPAGRAGSAPGRLPGARRAEAGRGGAVREARGRTGAGDVERLREVIRPVVEAAGYDLEDVTVSRAGRRSLVRVTVDTDGGVSLDDIAAVSRTVSAALDAAEASGGELVAGEYQLEVGSPGVDRPLTEPRHWRRNVGRLVKVRAGGRQLAGRVIAADAEGVSLDTGGDVHKLAYGQLGPGRVQIEFNRLDEVADSDLEEIADPDDEDGDDEELEDEER
jgi:ribosome maturation factor RimP